uniref:NADH-ubiquinone oxidoreductase chain 2 n=1 Tax=Caridina cf. nilotica HMG-2016 TaxID=1844717 RepID=A0A182BT61_9EUCA|nr:NADH dehydrogenase subunit 2 [Caridina cf. nilotica HMG-2016]ANC75346.1 NADH dehydrogenase subunit 2 [Caridina cf. nilotica HMG-2016]
MSALQPSQILFFSTLLMGTATTFSATSWFTAWIGLELNLLSFIPLLAASKSNQYSSESSLKYFLVQALGSALILASAPLSLYMQNSTTIIITLALLLKMGAAPFHFWFPPVVQGITWPQCIMISTIQKVAPMLLLTMVQSSPTSYVLMVASVSCAIVGAMGGLNQTLTRKILAYSSINHMAWMLAAIMFNEQMWTIYFLTYAVVSSSVMLILHSHQIFHFNQLSSFNMYSKSVTLVLFLSLLSMGGLPPLTGFFPKWLVIQQFITSDSFIWLSVLLMSALLTLFFYLRIAISSMVFAYPKMKISLISTPSSILLTVTLINFSPILYPFLGLFLY